MSLTSPTNDTPMLRQYREIKEQYPDTILFYRIGDFYEMFYDDAVTASKVLDIVLTSRNKNDPNPVPLCGIPHHSMQPYLEKLVEKGHKVAICDQVEDPKAAKGVVRREVTRVVTPGLSGALDPSAESIRSRLSEHQYLVAVHPDQDRWGVAVFDVSTGDFRVTEIEGGDDHRLLREELDHLSPREILMSESQPTDALGRPSSQCFSRLPAWIWDQAFARKNLYHQFRVSTLTGFGCEDQPVAIIAAGALLHYVKETQHVDRLSHIRTLHSYQRSDAMRIGEDSRKNLSVDELVEELDRTQTAMGRRRLKEWFLTPLLKKEFIERRLDAVEELKKHPRERERIQSELKSVYDLERINSRLALNTAHARDLKGLADSLEAIQKMVPLLSEFQAEEFSQLKQSWNGFESLQKEIHSTLVEEPLLSLKDGGLIREGVNPELDELRKLRSDAKVSIAAIEERERQRTGINSLKIKFNHVFGYYLEVSAAQLSKVPADFIRKQTLANAERYITPELKEFEDKVLGAEEKIKSLEYALFSSLREKALEAVPELQAQAERVGILDAFLSLGHYASEQNLMRPILEESGVLEIRKGRHPLVERALPSGSFVPNDLSMNVSGDRFLMITGPNMAGKSTVIRLVGVIVLMAQVGSFVPAESAKIGLVDQIFTRVGAADRLARGESTFMVEMCETALILNQATSRSLVLLDEIGRGTSTYDGVSIAWAVAEHLHDKIQARTLFATHYHELTDLALTCPGIKNCNVQVKEEGDDIVFLYRLIPGAVNRSFGIHVARLAGLPQEVVERAKEVLKNLEQGEIEEGAPRLGKKKKKDESQGSLF